MARSNAITKTRDLQADLKDETQKHGRNTPNKTDSLESANKVVDKALKSVRTLAQSLIVCEKDVQDAASAAFKHALLHNDARPADRLIKGLLEHPSPTTKSWAKEVMGWFKTNSPVMWDAWDGTKSVHVAKEGDPGYKPFNEKNAEETPFFETKIAKNMRQAAQAAVQRELKPADFDMAYKRAVTGMRSWYNNIKDGKDKRGFTSEAERKKIAKLINTIDEAVSEAFPREAAKATADE